MRLLRGTSYTWLSTMLWLIVVSSSAGALLAQTPNGTSALGSVSERQIRAADSARFEAMTQGNLAALDTLLGADLTYTHNDGSIQNKSALLSDLRSGELKYLALRPDSVVVRVYGTTGVADGRILIRARAGTQQGSFTARFLEVYVQRRGHWELVGWQSTRLTPIVLEK